MSHHIASALDHHGVRSPRTARPARTVRAAILALLAMGLVVAVARPATAATARPFTCTGTISRVYTTQTVTGTLTGTKPTATTVFDYTGTALLSTPAPARTNGWWSGYWKTTYGLNQWKLGKDVNGTVYHLMLPDTRPGAAFEGLLVSEFAGGAQGNWQNWMSCTTG